MHSLFCLLYVKKKKEKKIMKKKGILHQKFKNLTKL